MTIQIKKQSGNAYKSKTRNHATLLITPKKNNTRSTLSEDSSTAEDEHHHDKCGEDALECKYDTEFLSFCSNQWKLTWIAFVFCFAAFCIFVCMYMFENIGAYHQISLLYVSCSSSLALRTIVNLSPITMLLVLFRKHVLNNRLLFKFQQFFILFIFVNFRIISIYRNYYSLN